MIFCIHITTHSYYPPKVNVLVFENIENWTIVSNTSTSAFVYHTRKTEKVGQGHICGSQMDFYHINEMNVEWLYPKCQTFLMEELKTIKILKLFRQVVETCYKETLRNKYARNNRRRVEKVMQGTQDSVKYPNKSDSIDMPV